MHICPQSNCQPWVTLPAGKVKPLLTVLLLVVGFAAVEWVVGQFSHSLSLRSDSGHMIADAAAIAIAMVASGLARLPMLKRRRLSTHRLESGAALVNGLGLLAMVGMIAWEALKHIATPPVDILSLPMLLTATIGMAVNGVSAWLLHRDAPADLNLKGAFLHVLADLVSSIGVILGAIAMTLFHWFWLDGIVSLTVALLIGSSAVSLIQQSLQRWRHPSQPNLANLGFLEIGKTTLVDLLSQDLVSQAQDLARR
jgi:cobalt-zinc-cadmium efflux system protein